MSTERGQPQERLDVAGAKLGLRRSGARRKGAVPELASIAGDTGIRVTTYFAQGGVRVLFCAK